MLQSLWNHPSSYLAGLLVCLSLIMAIGPQNLHLLRASIERRHLLATLAVTVLADVVLIAVGIGGVAALIARLPWLHTAMVLGGVAFLGMLGWGAAQRLWGRAMGWVLPRSRPAAPTPDAASHAPLSRRQAVGGALAFTWLSPHAWLDAAVLIGGAALAHGAGQAAFGAGAATGSVLWFSVLAVVGWALGPRVLRSAAFHAVLDGLVLVIMWGTAGHLAWGMVAT